MAALSQKGSTGRERSLPRTRSSKLEPPAGPLELISRERARARLDELASRRLTAIIAGAGFGKSTLAADYARAIGAAWYTIDSSDASLSAFAQGLSDALGIGDLGLSGEGASSAAGRVRAESLAAFLSQALEVGDRTVATLVLDDVQELGVGSGSARLLEALCRQLPSNVRLVVCSRVELPFSIERLRGRGQVGEIGAAMLGFSVDEIDALLLAVLGVRRRDVAEQIQELTAGWPAAVRLVVDSLRLAGPAEFGRVLERSRRPSGPLFPYLADEVLSTVRPEVKELLRFAAQFPRVTPELCESAGFADAETHLAHLANQGFLLQRFVGESTSFALHALLQEFVNRNWPLGADEQRECRQRAAAWFEAHGQLSDALESLLANRAGDRVEHFLRRHASELLPAAAPTVVRAGRLVPAASRGDLAIERLLGDACLICGEREQALACFERAVGDADHLPPALAVRLGIVHHESDPARAIHEYERGRLDREDTADEALLLAFTSNAYFYLGRQSACREFAGRALDAAVASAESRALAHAHHALGLLAVSEGDVRAAENHFRQDLIAADVGGEIEQRVRAQANLANILSQQGRYREALVETQSALGLAELHGVGATFVALVLANRGQARAGLGELEQAASDLDEARVLYERLESSFVSPTLSGLGDIYRIRGDLALARACYEDALSASERSHTVQGRPEALVGLACLLAFEEPNEAQRLVEQALASDREPHSATVLLGAGWVALAHNEPERVRVRADGAAAAARRSRDRTALAESLELLALSTDDAPKATGLLEEARAIRRAIGNRLAEFRVELLVAHVRGASEDEKAEAGRRLEGHGVRVATAAGAAGPLAAVRRAATGSVAIRTLGRFAVLREGNPVELAEWQSKKARDLLKILVARRGQPTPRDLLSEWLWPEQDPQRTANRLSVALSTLRDVLDPESRYPRERFVAAKDVLRLDLSNVDVDVEQFLGTAAEGLAAHREGRHSAQAQLERAAAAYAGDFLEEDQYEDWTIPLREEVCAVYVSVMRALAESATSLRDHEAAARCWLRLLERDPHDEHAHLALVRSLRAAGHQGEARRRYRIYVDRMDEISASPAEFPA